MRATSTSLRLALALIVALAMVIAAPIHAAHHHGGDVDPLHGPCALCKSPSPASRPLAQPCACVPLQPAGVLESTPVPAPISAYETAIASRAPPAFFA